MTTTMFCALSRRHLGNLVAVLLLAVFSLEAAPAIPPPGQRWFAAESAHFRFVTDCSERRSRDLASDFETLRQVLNQITPGLRSGRYSLQSPTPTYVYLFDSGRDFDAHAGDKGWAGFFHRRDHGNFVALNAGLNNARRTVFHEYIHYFIANNFPGTPSWVNEGLAEFYSTMVLNGQEVVLGRPFEGHLTTLARQPPLPMATLVAQDWNLHGGTDERVRQHYYTSAWIAINYLLLGNPERRPQLGAFLEMIRSGIPLDEGFRQAFKCEPSALDQELLAYRDLFNTRYRSMTISLGKLEVAKQFAYAPLPRPEAWARLGVLAASGDPKKKAFALEHFKAALAEDPACATAHFGLGLVAFHEDRFAEAALAFDRASKESPNDPQMRLQAGLALFIAGTQGELDHSSVASVRPEFAQARSHLQRCLELDPTQGKALELLFNCYEMDPKRVAEGLPFMEQAVTRMPSRFDLKLRLATFFENAGRSDQSNILLKELAAQNDHPGVAESARLRLVVNADQHARKTYRAGMDAIKAGKREEGQQLITQATMEASPILKQEFAADQGRAAEKPIITLTGGKKTTAQKPKSPKPN